MSGIPSDPNIGKFYQPANHDPHSTPPPVDIPALQTDIAALTGTESLLRATAPHISDIAHLAETAMQLEQNNIKTMTDITTNPKTQCDIITALNKGGITPGDLYSILTVKFGTPKTPRVVTGEMTNVANIINKTVGFTPNPKVPNSKYLSANLFLMTWGFPPEKPSVVTYNNYGSTADYRAQMFEESSSLGNDLFGARRDITDMHLDPTFGDAQLSDQAARGDTPLAIAHSYQMQALILNGQGFWPDKPTAAFAQHPYILSETPKEAATINAAQSSMKTLESQYTEAVTSISLSLNDLPEHPNPAQELILQNLQQYMQENSLTPDNVEIHHLSEIAHQLSGAAASGTI
jgi:hypothetical protein